jgi:hypothetical protein
MTVKVQSGEQLDQAAEEMENAENIGKRHPPPAPTEAGDVESPRANDGRQTAQTADSA